MLCGHGWADLVSTSMVCVTTSRKLVLKAWGATPLKGPRENTGLYLQTHRNDTILNHCTVYRVLEELKYKHYSSQMERYLQLFHHRPVAASLYRKVCRCSN